MNGARFDRPGLLAGALLALALGVGFLGGIAADRLVFSPRQSLAAEPVAAQPADAGPAPRGIPGDRAFGVRGGPGARYMDVLGRELELTEEQRERIQDVLRMQQARMEEITRETRPRMRAVAAETREGIGAVLTPEQRARLDRLPPPRPRGGMEGPGRRGPRSGDGGRWEAGARDTVM